MEVVGVALLVKIISSVLVLQLPLLTVHLNVALVPAVTPVMVVVREVASVIVALPDTTLQLPVPVTGAVAFMIKVLVLH